MGSIAGWFAERKRHIFAYNDGTNNCRGDPIEIGTALERELPDYQGHLETLVKDASEVPAGPMRRDFEAQQVAAREKITTAARAVFGIPKLNRTGKGGKTDGEAIAVLVKYLHFMEGLALEARGFLTWPDTESVSPPASVIESSAASGTAAK